MFFSPSGACSTSTMFFQRPAPGVLEHLFFSRHMFAAPECFLGDLTFFSTPGGVSWISKRNVFEHPTNIFEPRSIFLTLAVFFSSTGKTNKTRPTQTRPNKQNKQTKTNKQTNKQTTKTKQNKQTNKLISHYVKCRRCYIVLVPHLNSRIYVHLYNKTWAIEYDVRDNNAPRNHTSQPKKNTNMNAHFFTSSNGETSKSIPPTNGWVRLKRKYPRVGQLKRGGWTISKARGNPPTHTLRLKSPENKMGNHDQRRTTGDDTEYFCGQSHTKFSKQLRLEINVDFFQTKFPLVSHYVKCRRCYFILIEHLNSRIHLHPFNKTWAIEYDVRDNNAPRNHTSQLRRTQTRTHIFYFDDELGKPPPNEDWFGPLQGPSFVTRLRRWPHFDSVHPQTLQGLGTRAIHIRDGAPYRVTEMNLRFGIRWLKRTVLAWGERVSRSYSVK